MLMKTLQIKSMIVPVMAVLLVGSLLLTSVPAEAATSTSTVASLQAQVELLKQQIAKLTSVGTAGLNSVIASNAVEVGDRIVTTTNVNVRETPAADGTKLGTVSTGGMGTVLSGPAKVVGGVITTGTTTDSSSFWQIKYDNGLTGWSSVLYVRDAGSGYGGDTSVAAKCNSFTFTPSSVNKGGQTTATWTTENASRIVLLNNREQYVKEFTNEQSYTFVPAESGTYILKVFGKNNTQSVCTAKITVKTVVTSTGSSSAEMAVCDSFKFTPANVKKGSDVTLSWKVSNANKVYLSSTLSGTTSTEYGPESSLSFVASKRVAYFLSVDNVNGTKRMLCSATLIVQDEQTSASQPICNSFVASPTTINKGDTAKLTWDTTNARYTSITSNGLYQKASLPADGSVSVTPSVSTDYILHAYGTDGTRVSCTVPVKVNR